jgi:type I restriction enzyme S subunit
MVNMVPVRRLARLVNGGTPPPAEEFWNGEVLWATPVDLASVDGRVLEQTQRTLTPIGAEKASVIVPAGSVLMSTRAPIGYLAINAAPMAFNQGCKALVPRTGTDARYLMLALWSERERLKSLGTGSTFMELGNEALLSFRVPVVDYREQVEIADRLELLLERVREAKAERLRQAELMDELATSLVTESLYAGGRHE